MSVMANGPSQSEQSHLIGSVLLQGDSQTFSLGGISCDRHSKHLLVVISILTRIAYLFHFDILAFRSVCTKELDGVFS